MNVQQHRCPWPFCVAHVDADLWGCKQHWYALPPVLRKALWLAYRPGQSIATASPEYLAASEAIDTWIRLYFQTKWPAPPERPPGRPPGVPRKPRPPQGDLPL